MQKIIKSDSFVVNTRVVPERIMSLPMASSRRDIRRKSKPKMLGVRYSQGSKEEMSGWLYKRGRRFHRKEKRWFKLSGTVLANHRNPDDAPTWELNILNCQVWGGEDPTELLLKIDEDRILRLFASTPQEKEKWITNFNRASTMRIENFYEVGEVLGQGEFGLVRKGVEKEKGTDVAIKSIRKKDYPIDEFYLLEREVNILFALNHPSIVKTLDVFETEDTLYIVMEYMEGGMLFDVLAEQPDGILTESNARAIMLEIFSAVRYLHEQKICHRDIKPENVLCTSKTPPLHPKLGDFGLANFIDRGNKMLQTQVGTPVFAAPEVVKNECHSYPVDVWSCGILMYNLLSGTLPFGQGDEDEEQSKEIFHKIVHCIYDFNDPAWDTVSKEAKDLIKQCLKKNPADRITAAQALKHSFFHTSDSSLGRLSYKPSRLHSSLRQQMIPGTNGAVKDSVYRNNFISI